MWLAFPTRLPRPSEAERAGAETRGEPRELGDLQAGRNFGTPQTGEAEVR